jgi:transcription antitermination factor NusG
MNQIKSELKVPVPPLNIKFHHNQKMKIIKNFYRGYTGRIKDYENEDGILYYLVELMIDDRSEVVRCSQDELKPSLF